MAGNVDQAARAHGCCGVEPLWALSLPKGARSVPGGGGKVKTSRVPVTPAEAGTVFGRRSLLSRCSVADGSECRKDTSVQLEQSSHCSFLAVIGLRERDLEAWGILGIAVGPPPWHVCHHGEGGGDCLPAVHGQVHGAGHELPLALAPGRLLQHDNHLVHPVHALPRGRRLPQVQGFPEPPPTSFR